MLKYPCLVLDHDDTVVQSMKTLSYPFFCYVLETFRPGASMSQEDYIAACYHLGFLELCRQYFHFTDREQAQEHRDAVVLKEKLHRRCISSLISGMFRPFHPA